MKVLSMLYVVVVLLCDAFISKFAGRNFEENGDAKVTLFGLLNMSKNMRKSWISSASMMQSDCGSVFCPTEKERKSSLILTRNSKL